MYRVTLNAVPDGDLAAVMFEGITLKKEPVRLLPVSLKCLTLT